MVPLLFFLHFERISDSVEFGVLVTTRKRLNRPVKFQGKKEQNRNPTYLKYAFLNGNFRMFRWKQIVSVCAAHRQALRRVEREKARVRARIHFPNCRRGSVFEWWRPREYSQLWMETRRGAAVQNTPIHRDRTAHFHVLLLTIFPNIISTLDSAAENMVHLFRSSTCLSLS